MKQRVRVVPVQAADEYHRALEYTVLQYRRDAKTSIKRTDGYNTQQSPGAQEIIHAS